MSETVKFVVHDSQGIHLWSTCDETAQLLKTFDKEKPINVIPSRDCRYLAIIFKELVQVFGQNDFENPIIEFVTYDAKYVSFSPKSTYLLIFETPNFATSSSNLKLFNLSDGNLIKEWFDKKRESIQWSDDESIVYHIVGSEILFYENNDFSSCVQKISQQKLSAFAFATNKAGCSFAAVFIKGNKGAPSTIRVNGYPHLENAIVTKSFYKVDTVEIKWNQKADAILVLASTDYDSSGKSYYGKTMLYFLDIRGNTSTITGTKEGTVSAAEWLPQNEGFIVIQGKMPATITWYNNRAEQLFSFGEAAVNGISINPFGNLVAFTGFGNLSGNIFIWNLRTKTLISNFNAVNTTIFNWLADGKHLITATHYDRLKVANGFKLWDFLGSMKHQHDCRDDSTVQLFNLFAFNEKSTFKEFQIDANTKGRVLSEEPVQKYVPPSLRNKSSMIGVSQKFASKPPPPPMPNHKYHHSRTMAKDSELTKEKKLKNLEKKLQQISKLKKLKEEGKELEKNQLKKINKEEEIIKEIEMLKMDS